MQKWLFALLSAFLFALATPFSKWLLVDVHPVVLAGLFYLGAGLVLLPWRWSHLGQELRSLTKRKSDMWRILGAVVFGGIVAPVLLLVGIRLVTSSEASLLLNLETVATAFLGWMFFKEHLSKYVVISSSLTVIAGVLIVIQFPLSFTWGGVFIWLACICWGLDNHLTSMVEGIHPMTNTIIKGLVAGVVNLCIAFFTIPIDLNAQKISISLVVGAFSYGVSIWLYIASAKELGATRSQIVFSLHPFLGALLGIVFLHDNLSWKILTAISLMIISLLILYREMHNHEHIHSEVEHEHEHSHEDGHHDHTHEVQETAKVRHTHPHHHGRLQHIHAHYPDLHHRHNH